MARDRKISTLYEKEEVFYKGVLKDKESIDENNPLKVNFNKLSDAYGSLLDEARIITSVSDRLQNKLNRTYDKLQEQSEEINKINTELAYNNDQLQTTVDELTKVKVSRKAATIVITLAIILFLVSEGLIEPIIEKEIEGPVVGFLLKGIIALLIKPIEVVVEKYLMRRRIAAAKE